MSPLHDKPTLQEDRQKFVVDTEEGGGCDRSPVLTVWSFGRQRDIDVGGKSIYV